jgi:uncharacterized membrane protein YraQ (UPF0718 family)
MKQMKLKGVKFLIVVIIVYILLLIFDNQNSLVALQKSGMIFLKLIPIFILIIGLTALINYLLKPKQIMKYFGKDSGAKGLFYTLLGGVISHGPMYAWYGMLEDMRSSGLRDGLIATFLYARAVKLPLLPFMVDMFGVVFTISMTFYTLIFAIIQGKIIDSINSFRENSTTTKS